MRHSSQSRKTERAKPLNPNLLSHSGDRIRRFWDEAGKRRGACIGDHSLEIWGNMIAEARLCGGVSCFAPIGGCAVRNGGA
ncbi:MAG: hypothetical protein LBP19_06285 [Treponema sp.]|nr:hypothetical protein [Treponema sp.]